MERVGIYNRCSTEEEAQMNALVTQAQESREIAIHKGWEITAQYIESETGTMTKHRMEYQRMMHDMESHLFDIVMIKSIDRLMRSTKDWYLFLDKLLTYEKKLFIYMDNKFYEPQKDALLSGMKAILAEDFSRELSEKIKHAHRRRQEKKSGFNITVSMFGWDKVGKDTYVVNESEAEYYRRAFSMAKEGCGFYTIAKYMEEQGVKSKCTGKKISPTQWRNMLLSPRAHGTVVLHQKTYDFYTKKTKYLPPQEWIFIEHALPPIVTKEYQEAVLAVIQSRKRPFYEEKKPKTPFSQKIYCGCCNSVYYRVVYHSGEEKELVEWKCSKKHLEGKQACLNRNVIESVLYETLERIKTMQGISLFAYDKKQLTEKVIRLIKEGMENRVFEQEQKQVEKALEEQSRKQQLLLNKLIDGVITDEMFQRAEQEIQKKIMFLQEKRKMQRNMFEQQEDCPYEQENVSQMRLEKISAYLENGTVFAQAETIELLRWLQKIVVYPNDTLSLSFQKQGEEAIWEIMVPYTHKDHKYREREQIKTEILELLKTEPNLAIKDLFPQFHRKSSYIRKCIRQLKEEGRLEFTKNERKRGGFWTVIDK